MDRRHNQHIQIKQYDTQKSDSSEILSNNQDEWNLNSFYLAEIGFLMSEWRLLNIYGFNGSTVNPEFYDRCIKILDSLLDLLAPKIKEEEEQKYETDIRLYEQQSKKLFIQSPDGRMLLDKKEFPIINRNIRKMFRSLLRELQLKGMLTQIHQDPKLAMMELD